LVYLSSLPLSYYFYKKAYKKSEALNAHNEDDHEDVL
jgi:hypothetical protein